ncbi:MULTISPECIES: LysR substrate-binding domain-containing protein [Pandoraea]|uniref:HTH-type transcriptional regulator BenM n=1 Tax=Pandoraea cepalis TaxID=2508294 RepID=A0A5E4V5Q5_9BURK|nr:MULTISPECIES: LysR substrate-binding domain-containing protein [Pandoraea]QBC31318.1 LysR family transcriptional regulator [Pandoraea sp. XY-2]VVE06719.1 HTH-type transcriptional regulator BenM [Pandoraea cepalis]
MELRHLRYFVAVAEALHFSRAAQKLNIGQPPLSMQIRALEDELGVALFERSQRRVFLTTAGRAFLVRARQILADAEAARQEVQQIAGLDAGELRIAFTTSAPMTNLMKRVLTGYRLRYPRVTLTLIESPSERQRDALTERTLDIGLVRQADDAPPIAGLSFETLIDEALVVVLHQGHALSGRASLSMADLAHEAFIMHPHDVGTAIDGKIRRMCERAGFSPRVVQEARESTTIVALAASGLGVAILPAAVRCIQIEGACFMDLSEPDAHTPLLLAKRRDDTSPLVQAFVAICREVAGRLHETTPPGA